MPEAPSFVEILNPRLQRGVFRAVLFDFDGTLSFLREGWPEIMTRMMVGVLRQAPHAEQEHELARMVDGFIMRLNGKSTIHQMTQLAAEFRKRGGTPDDPLKYKQSYVDELMAMVHQRRQAVAVGSEPVKRWAVPGSHRLLELLRSRDMPLTLASGTDRVYVVPEAELLGFSSFFGPRIFAPVHEEDDFSKQGVIADKLHAMQLAGSALLSFGDGMVETVEVKRAGGTAIGVASDLDRPGTINAWKRKQLAEAGADAIVADYAQAEELVTWLCH